MYKKLVYLTLISAVLILAKNTTADIVAYYPMDEGSGTVVIDASGNGHDATIVGTVNWVQSKPDFGTALDFPGDAASANCVRAGTWDPSESTGQVSVAAWIKWAGANSTSTFQGIVTKCDGVFVAIRWQLTMSNSTNEIGFGFGGGAPVYPAPAPPVGEWQHVALTHDGTTATMYINGANVGTSAIALGTGTGAAIVIGALNFQSADADAPFNGTVDEVYIFDTALSAAEVGQVMQGAFANPYGSKNPNPPKDETDVPRDTVLGWTAGKDAVSHDVYFGTNADDVGSASQATPKGVLAAPGQSGTTYDPPGYLEFGQTYYWRVDEVNSVNPANPAKGDVWSFTVEPYAIPIDGENITATASSNAANQGPEKTIDGSGLDENDLHSINSVDMWLSSAGDPGSAWIQYEFDKSYKLHEMLIWNYNGNSILALYGIKEVTIEYSADGVTWMQADISELPQAIGEEGYAADTIVPFDAAEVKYVKITADNNHGGGSGFFNKYGLSEVRFMVIPVFAREPSPESEKIDVTVVSSLAWRAGREAAEHNVYISTDQQAVIDSTASLVTISQAKYSPAIDLSNTYYWRIDEVNNSETPSIWQGDIWSFTTQDYLVVDDFESYNDIEAGKEDSHLVYETWVDGIANPSKGGSQMGYFEGSSLETGIAHGGNQSVPLFYDNTGSGSSEVTANTSDLPIGGNWSTGSPQTLILWIRGDLVNTAADRLYARIGNTKVTFDGNLSVPLWKQWNINLTGMNLSNVATLSIGIEGNGSGMIFLDDFMLYRTAPPVVQPEDPGTDNLMAQYTMENNVQDSSGNNLNGTAYGNPVYEQGLPGYGMALTLDGEDDYVELPIGSTVSTLTDCTIAMWVNWSGEGNDWQRIFDIGTGTTVNMFLTPSNGSIMRFAITTGGNGAESQLSASDELLSGWHHVAVTIDGTSMSMALYFDAQLVANASTQTVPSDLGQTTNNWLGRSQYTDDPYFNGSLDDFRIYNIALSEGQVRFVAGDR
jgi:hypothetical protein